MSHRSLSFQNPVQALKRPGYFWLWLSRLLTESAMRIGSVATSWLIYELTGSALALGWVGAGRALAAVILSPWAGVLSDRVEKRRIMVICRWAMAGVAAGVAALACLDIIQVWHLALASLLTGAINAFYNPASSASLPELVGKDLIMNAMSLNAIGLGIASMVFPAISGQMVEWWGVPMVLVVYAIVYALAAVTTHFMPLIKVRVSGIASPLRSLRDGVQYTVRDAVLTTLVLMVIVRFFLAAYGSLVTVFVSDELQMGAGTLGLLLSISGFGALSASIVLACMHSLKKKGRLLVLSIMGSGVLLAGLAFSHWLPAIYVVMFLLGAASNVQRVTNLTLLQTESAPEYRGRVMSLYGVCQACGPIGGIVFGALTDASGVAFTLVVKSVAIFVVAAFIIWRVPRLWRSA